MNLFTKKELLIIFNQIDNDIVRKKIIKKLKLKRIDYIYTQVLLPNGKLSKKFKNSDDAYKAIENIIGKWSEKSKGIWDKYEFIHMEYGNEITYKY